MNPCTQKERNYLENATKANQAHFNSIFPQLSFFADVLS